MWKLRAGRRGKNKGDFMSNSTQEKPILKDKQIASFVRETLLHLKNAKTFAVQLYNSSTNPDIKIKSSLTLTKIDESALWVNTIMENIYEEDV
jgi:hypothetical protein